MPYLPPTYPGKQKGAGRKPYLPPTYHLPTPYLPRPVNVATNANTATAIK